MVHAGTDGAGGAGGATIIGPPARQVIIMRAGRVRSATANARAGHIGRTDKGVYS